MFYFQLRNELRKMFGKKRTYIGFGAFLLAEVLILVMLRYTKGPRHDLTFMLQLNGYDPAPFITNLTMCVASLFPIALLLLPIYVALVGGDLLAKEAEDGTLRMILSRPISRFRLAMVKWMAGLIFSFMLAFSLGVISVAVASCLFPTGGLFVYFPPDNIFGVYEAGEGWGRFVVAILMMTVGAATTMGWALMFSCFNVKPAAATILAISFVLTSRVVQDMPVFHDLKDWFFTHHMDCWMKIFDQRIPWSEIFESLSILCGYNFTLIIIGCVAFQVRDIKS